MSVVAPSVSIRTHVSAAQSCLHRPPHHRHALSPLGASKVNNGVFAVLVSPIPSVPAPTGFKIEMNRVAGVHFTAALAGAFG